MGLAGQSYVKEMEWRKWGYRLCRRWCHVPAMDGLLEHRRDTSGPLPKAAADSAVAAYREYLAKLEALSTQYGKPVGLFQQVVGETVKRPRQMNAWNAFQAWYGEFGDIKHDPDMSKDDWVAILSEDWQKRKDDPQVDMTAFRKEVLDWYDNGINLYVEKKREKGNLPALTSRILDPFIKMSRQVRDQYNLQVFGWLIDTERDAHGATASVAWGGSDEYKELRAEYSTVLTQQASDYEGMFKHKDLRDRERAVAKGRFVPKLIDDGPPRDRFRRNLGEYLRCDIGGIIGAKLSDKEASVLVMRWKDWCDFAYTSQMCLVGWHADLPALGPDFNFKKLKQKPLEEMVKARTDSPNSQDVVRVIPWSEADKQRQGANQADIPLLVDTDRTVLLKVSDSTKFLNTFAKSKSGARRPPVTIPEEPSDTGSDLEFETEGDYAQPRQPVPRVDARRVQRAHLGPAERREQQPRATTSRDELQSRKRAHEDHTPAVPRQHPSEPSSRAPVGIHRPPPPIPGPRASRPPVTTSRYPPAQITNRPDPGMAERPAKKRKIHEVNLTPRTSRPVAPIPRRATENGHRPASRQPVAGPSHHNIYPEREEDEGYALDDYENGYYDQ
ncbi:hypothetical protein FPV67DRAFT_1445808 [Lyophyllum atratum]|nr:hypothetical protein FPV67DRAFT_1445808 [Lyophyllum atratum]